MKEAYACAPSDVVTIDTIELTNPSGGDSLYLVQQRSSVTATLETGVTVEFDAVPFRFSLPAAGENGRQDLTLAIDNIDRRVSDFVNAAKSYSEPVRCIYRPYLSNDLTRPQMDPPLSLKLTSITATVVEVQARATFGDVLNMPFPSQLYTRARFPGLGG
jgi:hypothetical protein